MRRGFLVLLLFIAIVAVVVSGCGGSDGSADTTAADTSPAEAPAAIPKAEFVKQANAICAKTNQELTQISEKFAKENNLSEKQPPTDAQVEELASLALPPISRQVEEIRALDAPSGDEQKVDAILSAAEEAIEKGEQDPSAIYGAGGGAFAKANQLSSDYGLQECSE